MNIVLVWHSSFRVFSCQVPVTTAARIIGIVGEFSPESRRYDWLMVMDMAVHPCPELAAVKEQNCLPKNLSFHLQHWQLASTTSSLKFRLSNFTNGHPTVRRLAPAFRNGRWNPVIWPEAQQEPHRLPPLRQPLLSHPERALRILRISRCAYALLWVG